MSSNPCCERRIREYHELHGEYKAVTAAVPLKIKLVIPVQAKYSHATVRLSDLHLGRMSLPVFLLCAHYVVN